MVVTGHTLGREHEKKISWGSVCLESLKDGLTVELTVWHLKTLLPHQETHPCPFPGARANWLSVSSRTVHQRMCYLSMYSSSWGWGGDSVSGVQLPSTHVNNQL